MALSAPIIWPRPAGKCLCSNAVPLIGGACVTEPLWPGYKVSTASYVVSLLLPEVVRDLELERHGYRVLKRTPSSFTPLEDGRYLLLGSDQEFNRQQIAKFSDRDAANYADYESLLEQVADCLEPVLSATPAGCAPVAGGLEEDPALANAFATPGNRFRSIRPSKNWATACPRRLNSWPVRPEQFSTGDSSQTS